MKTRYPNIIIDGSGENGNIFSLMGVFKRAMKDILTVDEINSVILRVSESGSYANAIAILNEYVTIKNLGDRV